jgi:diguanylate cyclase (GGDEF)-like protein
MISSIKTMFSAFRRSGGAVNRKGLNFIGLNLSISAAFILVCIEYSHSVSGDWDYIHLVLRSLTIVTHIAMFSLVIFISLKRHIKYSVVSGLFLYQIGTLVSLMNVFRVFDHNTFFVIRDLAYFSGGVFIAAGSTAWVVLTYKMSVQDALTKTHNRRFFEAAIEHYLKGRQEQTKSSFLMSLDLDDFKKVNDDFGHAKGDEVLKIVAEVLKNNARVGDIVCRSGGEEFEVLLLNCELDDAKGIAKRVLNNLIERTPDNLPKLTASIGLTQIFLEDSADSARKRADDAMYKAKRGGKAQVIYQD